MKPQVKADKSKSTVGKLEITGKCQLECVHCYADSGPTGHHGVMQTDDWSSVIDQVAGLGARTVQFIGGEPTLHPALPELISGEDDALSLMFPPLMRQLRRRFPELAPDVLPILAGILTAALTDLDAAAWRDSFGTPTLPELGLTSLPGHPGNVRCVLFLWSPEEDSQPIRSSGTSKEGLAGKEVAR